MGNDPRPLFFGGLPPRGSVATAEKPVEKPVELDETGEQEPRKSKNKKRLTLALLIVGACVLAVVAALIGVSCVTAAFEPKESKPGPIGSDYVPTEAEAAAAEAAVAEGGGAVNGHIVSGELCSALDSFVAVSSDAISSMEVSPETLAAMEGLAAVESPNQKAYQGFVSLVKDPASVTSIADAQALSADFAKATQVDVVTCM